MYTTPTAIPDVLLLTPDIFPDDRGSFFESYNQEKFRALGIGDAFIQDNISISKAMVLRGLHYQAEPHMQGKLVSVLRGEVLDVAVDIRLGSPTYGKWVSAVLSEENHQMLYIPSGFAHGFFVRRDAIFSYKVSGAYYVKEAATGIIWNDPTLAIDWGFESSVTPILSAQDQALPLFGV